MNRSSLAAVLLTGAAVLAVTPGCTATEQPLPDPVLLIEAGGSKSDAIDLVLVDLSGRELVRQSTGATIPLSSLHEASARVAFWRDAGAAQELVVWDIATTVLKVITTSAIPLAQSPIWSIDGTEIVSLHTTTPINWTPGAPFDGKAEISIATAATGQIRTLATDRPLIPTFANGTTVGGATLSGEKKYLIVDARSGRTLHEFPLTAIAVLPTASPDVVIAMRETSAPDAFTFHALNARTGAELGRLGPLGGQSFPLWPGRSEVVFVEAGELKAFDYEKNTTRVVGRLEGATAAIGFDPLGRVLLAARPTEPFYGTFTVTDARLTSAVRLIPRDPSSVFGRALGLVRIKV